MTERLIVGVSGASGAVYAVRVLDALAELGVESHLVISRSAALTLTMKPGKYVLYCNLPGHYMAGMWTVIDVAP